MSCGYILDLTVFTPGSEETTLTTEDVMKELVKEGAPFVADNPIEWNWDGKSNDVECRGDGCCSGSTEKFHQYGLRVAQKAKEVGATNWLIMVQGAICDFGDGYHEFFDASYKNGELMCMNESARRELFFKDDLKHVKAILSTTVLPKDGTYKVETIYSKERELLLNSLQGIPHYIGHPDTKAIVETLGAIQAPTKLFEGLEPGDMAVCFPIKQGLSSRASDGFTIHQAITEVETLDVRLITRLVI